MELNPGPITGIFFKRCNRPIISTCIDDPKKVLRSYSAKLTAAISGSLSVLTSELYAKDLISLETKEEMLVGAATDTNYTKASKLVNAIERQLESSHDQKQYLTEVCDILKCQKQKTIVRIAASMLGESTCSLHVDVSIIEPDIQSYIDIMRQQYNDQPIVADADWPPKVGHDIFGKLALIKKSKRMKQEQLARYMLRGKVDELLKESEKITIEDVLQSPPLRVVIDGPPGIGKTTLCRKLLKMWSNGELPHQQFHLALYCPLRNDQIASATSLSDLFVYKSPKLSKVVEWLLNEEGQGLLIIFDGWDELTTQLRETSLAASIIRREQLDKCSVVVTSRSYASSSLLRMSSINKHIQVIGFSLNEIKRVIIQTLQKDPKLAQEIIEENTDKMSLKSHFTTAQNSKDSRLAVKLINDLNIRHDVQSLCYIPLVCSMVILVYHKGAGNLPTTLTELYENFVLQTIKRHIHVKRRDTTEDPYSLLSLSSLPSQLDKCLKDISQIAYTNLASTRMTFTLDQLQEQSLETEDYLGLMTTFLEYDEKKYQFLHLSIQEFLAAWWIVKHEDPKELFKNHFDDDHFQMCVRFVAGLTHLNDESYQKYFIRNLDLQCIRVPFFGFDTDSLLYQNPEIAKRHPLFSSPNYNSDNFIILLQLLYESKNKELCQMLAKFIANSSLCLNEAKLSSFDTLCLSYFINNSNVTWEFLHLTDNSAELLTFISSGIQCKKLQVEVADGLIESFFRTSSFIYASNVQECRCTLYGNYSPCVALLHLLKLPQVKILHVAMVPDKNSKLVDENAYSELQKCIEVDPKLQELAIEYYCQFESNELEINTTCVIRGVAKNKVLTTFSLYIHHVDQSYEILTIHSLPVNCSPLPAGIIEQLLKDNITLKSLELIIPNKLLSAQDHLNEIEINTPLTTLVIGFMPKLKVPHMIETLAILKPQPQPPYPLFHPFLQVLILHLESLENATELFEILQTNTTLKSLILNMVMEYLDNSIMCKSLQCMLIKNYTLCSFEVEVRPRPLISEILPLIFIISLTKGLKCNTTIRKLSIPIRLPLLENGEALFNLISQKNNFFELQLNVFYEDLLQIPNIFDEASSPSSGSGSSSSLSLPSSNSSQYSKPIEVLFNEGLPAIIKMLESLTSIRLLRIRGGSDYTEVLVQDEIILNFRENIQKFHKTVFSHPSLEYVEIEISGMMMDDEMLHPFEKERRLFITKFKQEHPHKSFPIVDYR